MNELKTKYINEYGLSEYDAELLTKNPDISNYYDSLVKVTDDYTISKNILLGCVLKYCAQKDITINEFPLDFVKIAIIVSLIATKKITFTDASTILFDEVMKYPDKIVYDIAKNLNLIKE
jgi:aspartyl-tRNA(Asn)/glutamyl-tRNA(Gln) amidotransferase subunit B